MKRNTNTRIGSKFLSVIILFILSNGDDCILLRGTTAADASVVAASVPCLSSSIQTSPRSSSSSSTTSSSIRTRRATKSRTLFQNEEDQTLSSSTNTQSFLNCKPAPSSQCEICTSSALESSTSSSSSRQQEQQQQLHGSAGTACEATGKHRLYLCQSLDNEDDDNPSSSSSSYNVKVYKSCHRTKLDEDYLMYRLQGLCMALAFLSLKSVRREKVTSESLFDQRKRRMAAVAAAATVQRKDGISGQQRQMRDIYHQEMVPLKDTVGQESFDDEQVDEEIGRFSGVGRNMDGIVEEQEEDQEGQG